MKYWMALMMLKKTLKTSIIQPTRWKFIVVSKPKKLMG